jgi:hypothetical protein
MVEDQMPHRILDERVSADLPDAREGGGWLSRRKRLQSTDVKQALEEAINHAVRAVVNVELLQQVVGGAYLTEARFNDNGGCGYRPNMRRIKWQYCRSKPKL